MTTKEFIQMLQEADPSGNAHIRMEGGIPLCAELKEGYWDGPYSYVDEEGNYVYSTKGNKVDIHCRDIHGFVEYHFDLFEPGNWERIKQMFKFELSYSISEHRKEREDRVIASAKEAWDEYYEIYNKFFEEEKKISLERALKGWTWFQNKLVDDETLRPNMHYHYTWKIYSENGKEDVSNVYNTQGVWKSGLFDRLDNDKKPGYYEWVLKQ